MNDRGVDGPNGRGPHKTPVAVVGLGCVLPDALAVPTFWQNLLSGRSSVREVPPDRWEAALFRGDPSHRDRTYSTIGSFVTGYRFDALRHRMPPRVAQATDPSQLWAIDAATQAIADAGYDRRPFDRSRCEIVLGCTSSEEVRVPSALRTLHPLLRRMVADLPSAQTLPPSVRERLLAEFEEAYRAAFPAVTEDTLPGELANLAAGRVANALDLTGKNYTTDAACASSLAALEVALHGLHDRDCDMVLTGGTDRNQGVSMYVKFCRIGALSAEGSFPFDARASGFVMGEGAAVFLLKRLDDAVRDGDRIHAVIRGIGGASDGRGKGITAPSAEGQAAAIRRAYEASGVGPDDIDFLECHGTATPVGDAAELAALERFFGGRPPRSVPIGSVKSNLGHLKAAAGAVGLLKAVLAVREGIVPPSLGFERPNAALAREGSPFVVNTRPLTLPARERPHRCGVSSFGFGGTNFHAVVESPPRLSLAEEPTPWPLLVA